MQLLARLRFSNGPLPIILIASIVQGWSLYALHRSIDSNHWPATALGQLLGLYALVVIVPLTVQLLSEHARNKLLWIIVGTIGLTYFYFGYHHGSTISQNTAKEFFNSGDFFLPAVIMGLLWLLLMPFVQVRLSDGDYKYASLFTTAWRNKLLLAEAAAFTGLFWLLLMLWQVLFAMLGIGFFKDLFQKPIFIYPVTTLVFGIALHLIGSVERLIAAILEQVLSVLKWLAIVAGVILSLFTIALVFKLPGLVFEGQKAIGAAWLLWLVAVIVLLVNAAYRDGKVAQPYPRWIAQSLRWVIPLTVIISTTALYALVVRARNYGVTVERVWAFIVAGTALSYSLGYSVSAIRDRKWLDGIGRVNVYVALALIATIAATLTPVLSPYRLAANSQFRMALEKSAVIPNDRSSAFHYLRFQAGRYGVNRLTELSTLQEHPDAARIRVTSLKVLKLRQRWDRYEVDANAVVNELALFPANRQIDAKLRAALAEGIGKSSLGRQLDVADNERLGGIFIDLNADATEEFVLLHQNGGDVYQRQGDDWEHTRGLSVSNMGATDAVKSALESVAKGDVTAAEPEWKNLQIGDHLYRVIERR